MGWARSVTNTEHNEQASLIAQIARLFEQALNGQGNVGTDTYTSLSRGEAAKSASQHPTVREVVASYVKAQKSAWKSANTRATNMNYLNRLVNRVGDKPFTKETLEAYFITLDQLDKRANHYGQKAGCHLDTDRDPLARSPTSIYNQKRLIKACNRCAYSEGLIPVDLFSGPNGISLSKPQTEHSGYDESDILKLLQCTAEPTGKRERKTTRRQWRTGGPLEREQAQAQLLVRLLLETAGRATEICRLSCGHIRQNQVLVTGKGGKPGRLYLSSELLRDLRTFAGDRPDKEPLFRNWRGKPCTKDSLLTILRRLALRAEVALPADPIHSFRHFVARQWTEEGVPLHIIQKYLRHTNIQTTLIYASPDQYVVEKEHQRIDLANALLRRAQEQVDGPL